MDPGLKCACPRRVAGEFISVDPVSHLVEELGVSVPQLALRVSASLPGALPTADRRPVTGTARQFGDQVSDLLLGKAEPDPVLAAQRGWREPDRIGRAEYLVEQVSGVRCRFHVPIVSDRHLCPPGSTETGERKLGSGPKPGCPDYCPT